MRYALVREVPMLPYLVGNEQWLTSRRVGTWQEDVLLPSPLDIWLQV